MASFDFIRAASKGYEFVWRRRSYLARVAFPVIFVKVACLLAILVLQLQDQYLRQGLVLMPSFFLEALFMVGMIRYILYREPIFVWGKQHPVPEMPLEERTQSVITSRQRAMQIGVAIYLLVRVVESALGGVGMDLAKTMSAEQQAAQQEAGPAFLGIMMFMVIFTFIVWAFRFLWLYIPAAMGVSIRGFLLRIRGMQSSFAMLGVWLICYVPLVILFSTLIQLTHMVLPPPQAAGIVLSAVVEAIGGFTILAVQIAGMTYGFMALLSMLPDDEKDKK